MSFPPTLHVTELEGDAALVGLALARLGWVPLAAGVMGGAAVLAAN